MEEGIVQLHWGIPGAEQTTPDRDDFINLLPSCVNLFDPIKRSSQCCYYSSLVEECWDNWNYYLRQYSSQVAFVNRTA